MPKVNTAMVYMEGVEKLMTAKYLTWSELALRADLSYATMHALKVGRRKASFRTICKIARALSVEPCEIVEE